MHAFQNACNDLLFVNLIAFRARGQYRVFPLDVREFPEDKSKQRKESTLSYQEALKQQVQHHIYDI